MFFYGLSDTAANKENFCRGYHMGSCSTAENRVWHRVKVGTVRIVPEGTVHMVDMGTVVCNVRTVCKMEEGRVCSVYKICMVKVSSIAYRVEGDKAGVDKVEGGKVCKAYTEVHHIHHKSYRVLVDRVCMVIYRACNVVEDMGV